MTICQIGMSPRISPLRNLSLWSASPWWLTAAPLWLLSQFLYPGMWSGLLCNCCPPWRMMWTGQYHSCHPTCLHLLLLTRPCFLRLRFISHPQCLPQCLPLHLRKRSICPPLLFLPTMKIPLLTGLHPHRPFSSPWTLLYGHTITHFPQCLTRDPPLIRLTSPLTTHLSQKHQMISSYLQALASLAGTWCVHVDAIAFVGHVAPASAFVRGDRFLTKSHDFE